MTGPRTVDARAETTAGSTAPVAGPTVIIGAADPRRITRIAAEEAIAVAGVRRAGPVTGTAVIIVTTFAVADTLSITFDTEGAGALVRRVADPITAATVGVSATLATGHTGPSTADTAAAIGVATALLTGAATAALIAITGAGAVEPANLTLAAIANAVPMGPWAVRICAAFAAGHTGAAADDPRAGAVVTDARPIAGSTLCAAATLTASPTGISADDPRADTVVRRADPPP